MDIFSIIYPPVCFGCGQTSDLICQNCSKQFIRHRRQQCPFCGAIVVGGKRCQKCVAKTKLNQVVAVYYYRDNLAQIIQKAKYNYWHGFSHFASYEMADLATSELDLSQHWIIVPAPQDPVRKRKFGYHFAHILAKRIGKRLGVAVDDCLVKKMSTPEQASLKRQKRFSEIKDKFLLKHKIESKNIILVDDVFTTGATLGECGRVLKENNPKIKVVGLVLARG